MDDRYCVPDFEINNDYFMPSTSAMNRSKKSAIVEDEMMELLWQNGQVVAQSQNQKSNGGRKSRGGGEAVILNAEVEAEGDRTRTAAEETARQHVFMQEDEMASWLHYSFDEPEPVTEFDHPRDDYRDLIYPPPSNKEIAAAPSREIRNSTPEIRPQPSPSQPPQSRRVDLDGSSMFQDFMNFARVSKEGVVVASSSKAAEILTVVESNSTTVPAPRNSTLQVGPNNSANEAATRELTARCELTMASSPGASRGSASASAERPLPPPPPAKAADRKRKGREADDNEDNNRGVEIESGVTKKQARGSTTTKKSRAAEVHNLSERKRRDRINEKMKALQELIPRCNKSDKASMLDEAIEYLKSLQLQVQMMSMGCSMVPVMYPGMQHYMPAMGMGMGMGMGMSMDMGMNRPMVQYPHPMPNVGAPAGHMGARFPMPTGFHIPPVPVHVPDPSRVQVNNGVDSALNSSVTHSLNQPRFPNFVDPFHQFHGLHHGQQTLPLSQNQAIQTSIEKPAGCREVSNTENHQPG